MISTRFPRTCDHISNLKPSWITVVLGRALVKHLLPDAGSLVEPLHLLHGLVARVRVVVI